MGLELTPRQVKEQLKTCILNRRNILLVGQPGIGKTSIVKQISDEIGYRLIYIYLSVSEPTDVKGFGWIITDDGNPRAEFIPFGDFLQIIGTNEKIICFFDDIGQSQVNVQASIMQIVGERRLNNRKIGEGVSFVGATNDRTHRAGVNAMIEPLKRRFVPIIHIRPSIKDFIEYSSTQSYMPPELISFCAFRGDIIRDFKPTADLTNSASPATIHELGKLMTDGIAPGCELAVMSGAIGEGRAYELMSFLSLLKDFKSIDTYIDDPYTAILPESIDKIIAIASAIVNAASEKNLRNIMILVNRMPEEIGMMCVYLLFSRKPHLKETEEGIKWLVDHKEYYLT